VRYLSLEVVLELDEAIDAYEHQRLDRGARFEAAVNATYQRIASRPLSFPRSHIMRRPVLRRARVARFPYSIYFYLLRGEPIIVAIAHGRRRPAYWSERLR
jgi:plasmid stabilization system protein ParE